MIVPAPALLVCLGALVGCLGRRLQWGARLRMALFMWWQARPLRYVLVERSTFDGWYTEHYLSVRQVRPVWNRRVGRVWRERRRQHADLRAVQQGVALIEADPATRWRDYTVSYPDLDLCT